jgi:hypothetical protein
VKLDAEDIASSSKPREERQGSGSRPSREQKPMVRGTIPDVLGAPVRVHDMHGDDLGIVHVPMPVEPGDLILLERREYRVLDVIPVEDARYRLHALVRAGPAHRDP